ncbi:MAG: hypothetical protein GY811_00380 [Myxococcales bacterium]|nr:hypothetical protein [Myxococcales bacterium]
MKSRRRRKDGTVRLGKAYRHKLGGLVASNDVTARVRARAQILLLSDRRLEAPAITQPVSR